MTRLDELTNRAIDAVATGEELDELDRLIAGSPDRDAWRDLLDLEGSLRARGPVPSVAADAMAAVRRGVRESVTSQVMDRVRAIRPRRSVRVARARAAAFAVAASILALAAGGTLVHRARTSPRAAPRLASDAPAEAVPFGLAVRTAPGQARRFAYDDGTTIVVDGASDVAFGPDRGAKAVTLERGSLDADVAPQPARAPMTLTTPGSVLTVVGTRFGLAAGAGGALLDVASGRVQFLNAASGRSVEVAAGQYGVATRAGTIMTSRHPGNADRAGLARLVLAPPADERRGDEAEEAGARAVVDARRGENLLANPEFVAWGAEGPASWEAIGEAQVLRQDAAPAHDRAPAALRVEVVREDPGRFGQILQMVRVNPNERYVLDGDLKGTRDDVCFYEVKLRSGRRELSRIDSPGARAAWQRVAIEFDTGTADNVLVLCRYRQQPASVGATCWWTAVSLRRVGGGD